MGRISSMATRTEALGGVLKSKFTRLWVFGGAGAGLYQFGCDQFDWPKLPALWGMTGVLVPWWAWLVIAQLGFTYGLFEYVRRGASPSPVSTIPPQQAVWNDIRQNMATVSQSLGQALGMGGALRYRAAVADAEGFLLQLAQRYDLELPELRRDGEKLGCMRAILYITDLAPTFQAGDVAKARERASELTRWLNGSSEDKLAELVRLDDGMASYF